MDIKDLKNGIQSDEDSFYFRAKNELIQYFVSKYAKNAKILILGNGPSQSLSVLKKYGKIYATDIDQKSLDLIPKNIFFKKTKADICNTHFKKDFFDIIICCDVLEHVKDDKKAVNEMKRILKKNGKILCTVPAFQKLFSSHDKALGHIRRYSKNNILNMMEGLKIEKLSYWNFFMFFPIALKRLISKKSDAKVDELSKIPPILNKICYFLLLAENNMLKKLNFPFGLSLFIIAEK